MNVRPLNKKRHLNQMPIIIVPKNAFKIHWEFFAFSVHYITMVLCKKIPVGQEDKLSAYWWTRFSQMYPKVCCDCYLINSF